MGFEIIAFGAAVTFAFMLLAIYTDSLFADFLSVLVGAFNIAYSIQQAEPMPLVCILVLIDMYPAIQLRVRKVIGDMWNGRKNGGTTDK